MDNKEYSKIIYKDEFDFIPYKTIKVPYCGKYSARLSLLGLLDSKTKKQQYICSKCNKKIVED